MKHCPKCDFSFADFHHVCDFDGTELVDDPERPLAPEASSTAAGSASHLFRVLKSPVFLTGLAVMALVASALLIGYFDSANQPNSIAQNRAPGNSVLSSVPPAQTPAQIETRAPSSTRSDISNPKAAEDLSSVRAGQVTASRSRLRFHSSASMRNQPGRSRIARQKQSETAAQRESREIANEKEPKLTALLKTTWHILKKPFKF